MTRTQKKVLEFLRDNPDEDIMIDGKLAYYGDTQTSIQLVYGLLRICAISEDGYSAKRFSINETGLSLLSDSTIKE